MEKAEVDSMEDAVSQDSTAYDFNIRIICFLGLSLGTFVIALMCLCKSYEWCCKSPGLNNLRHQQQDDNDDHDDTQEIEAETSPLINNSIASQESSTNYHTALQDGFSFSSSSSSSSQPESIVIVE